MTFEVNSAPTFSQDVMNGTLVGLASGIALVGSMTALGLVAIGLGEDNLRPPNSLIKGYCAFSQNQYHLICESDSKLANAVAIGALGLISLNVAGGALSGAFKNLSSKVFKK